MSKQETVTSKSQMKRLNIQAGKPMTDETPKPKIEQQEAAMKVRVFPFRKDTAFGNIMWEKKFQMRGGGFPPSHPVGGGVDYQSGQYGQSPQMSDFRSRGYWASCFPEGDGITWEPRHGQSDEQCIKDVRSAFGWTAEWATE